MSKALYTIGYIPETERIFLEVRDEPDPEHQRDGRVEFSMVELKHARLSMRRIIIEEHARHHLAPFTVPTRIVNAILALIE